MTTPFLPTPAERDAARAHLAHLQAQAGHLPPGLTDLLTDVLSQLAAGKAVQVISLDREITPQQAADLLHVSRPYVVKLVELGQLPHRKVGPRRRLALADVLAYRARLEGRRTEALQALADDLQELGLD